MTTTVAEVDVRHGTHKPLPWKEGSVVVDGKYVDVGVGRDWRDTPIKWKPTEYWTRHKEFVVTFIVLGFIAAGMILFWIHAV